MSRLFHSKKFFVFNLALVSMIVGFVLATLLNFSCSGPKQEAGQSTVHAQDASGAGAGTAALEQMQYSFRKVAGMALPIVVEINVVEVISQRGPEFDAPWEFFFGPSPFDREQDDEQEYRQPGLGSGVIVRKDGRKAYVVTNNHVVGSADEISVRLHDGREYEARIVGEDPRTDLSLVMFETGEDVPVAVLGDSDSLQVGDWALAVGNPFGFESTVTAGIVSALGRRPERGTPIASFTDYIQTDAAINPGNSGGALVNLQGQVVGINTWIASRTGGSVGLGFAIPVNNAKKAIDDFIATGKVVYGWLGVQIGDPDDERYPGLSDDLKLEERSGALVLNLFQGSPAEKGGLLPGDYVIRINDTDIDNADHLTNVIGNIRPGENVSVEYIRYGRRGETTLTLETRESEDRVQADRNLWPGMVVLPIPREARERLGLSRRVRGVVVVGVVEGSPVATAGLTQGDIVTAVGDKSITSTLDFYRAVNESGGDEVVFSVYREGNELILGVSP